MKCKSIDIFLSLASCRLSLPIISVLLAVFGVIFVAPRPHTRRPKPQLKPPATESASIRIHSVAPKPPTILKSDWTIVSASIASLCGADSATADRYEARNDALRAIARERNLASNDVAALTAWLASTNDVLRVERLAALKNDAMKLLSSQEPPPEI